MFKNMKMAMKMALGFGSVIVLVVIVGIVAVVNMMQISGQSSMLNDAYVPEVAVANEIERGSLETMYAMRGYASSFDSAFYDEGMLSLDGVKESLTAAAALGESFEYLEVLRTGVGTAMEYVEQYEQLAQETKTVIDEIEVNRTVMDTEAAAYLRVAGEFLESQLQAFNADLARGAGSQALQERMRKVVLMNDALDVANNARVLNFKAQATLDTSYFNEAIRSLEAVNALGAELLTITRLQSDIDMIKMIGQTRQRYMQAVAATMEAYDTLNELGQRRDGTANSVLSSARDISGRGITTTRQISQAAVDKVKTAISLVTTGLVVALILAMLIAFALTRMITRALSAGVDFAAQIARGDLNATLNVYQKDEIGKLADALRTMLTSLQYKAEMISQFAAGDFSTSVELASAEDGLGESLETMRNSLNELLSQVNVAVSQVRSGSDQVSQASQSLSQGATEQASSLEEISASVTEVNGQSQQNAKNALEANALAKTATENAENGNKQMQGLVQAMGEINSSSEEIKKIVKIIDDIAFQINLLALNANVEAARAGKYGRGFAVVAEEVRNLAGRAADAVKETTTSVEQSVRSIEMGNQSAEATATQLEDIVDGVGKVATFLEEIAQASREQAQAVSQVTEGLDQIDQVTQANTASAEESASAAEELAGQAQQLQQMIAQFTLENRTVRQLAAPGAVPVQSRKAG